MEDVLRIALDNSKNGFDDLVFDRLRRLGIIKREHGGIGARNPDQVFFTVALPELFGAIVDCERCSREITRFGIVFEQWPEFEDGDWTTELCGSCFEQVRDTAYVARPSIDSAIRLASRDIGAKAWIGLEQ